MRTMILVVLMGWLLVACAGEDADSGTAPQSGKTTATQPSSASGTVAEDGQQSGMSDFPEPGETTLDLSGETFTFSGGTDCTVSDDSFVISGTTTVSGDNQIDIAIAGNRIGDQWAIGINALSSSSGISMYSQGDAVGTPIIEGNKVAVEAEFVRVQNEDFENAEPMGTGIVAANCE